MALLEIGWVIYLLLIAVPIEYGVYLAMVIQTFFTHSHFIGILKSFAGNGKSGYIDGDSSELCFPSGITADANGKVYLADRGNHCIRTISPLGLAQTNLQ